MQWLVKRRTGSKHWERQKQRQELLAYQGNRHTRSHTILLLSILLTVYFETHSDIDVHCCLVHENSIWNWHYWSVYIPGRGDGRHSQRRKERKRRSKRRVTASLWLRIMCAMLQCFCQALPLTCYFPVWTCGALCHSLEQCCNSQPYSDNIDETDCCT